MEYLKISDQSFFYRFSKRGADKEPAVICIHGSGADSVVWSYQLSRLSRYFNLIVPDLPGHGRSQGKPLETAEFYAHWLKSFADRLGLESFFLMGHSFGGAVIQEFARHYPGKVLGMVLAGTGTRFRFSKIYAELHNRGLTLSNTANIKEIISAFNLPETFFPNYEALKNMSSPALHSDLLAAGRFDSTDWISSLNIPSLVLWGENDQITPKALPFNLSEQLPKAQFKVIRNSGHVIMIDARDEFNSAVKLFIEQTGKVNV